MPNIPPISWDTKRLMMAEIDNEEEGGSPAVLWSALDSVKQGYVPFDEADMEFVAEELEALIDFFGPRTELEDFITSGDWENRSQSGPVRRAQIGPREWRPGPKRKWWLEEKPKKARKPPRRR